MAGRGHNSGDTDATGAYSVTADELRAFVERVETMEAEKKAAADDIKEIFAEAKGRGYDTKVMRKVYDTISDNAANAGIVLGAKRVDPLTTDLPWCGAILRQNGVVEETGLAAGVQGHPAVGIAWLANKLAPWGEYLQAGEIVLAGSFTKPALAKVGDVFDADYGPLGKLEFRFV